MQMRRLRHALIAVLVPAALVGATVAPAQAAKAPKLPTPAQVAAVYPHLAGVTPILVSGKAQPTACTPAKVVKGAKTSGAAYSTTSLPTSATPTVTVAAVRFKSAAKAKSYLKKAAAAITCELTALGFTATATKFAFKLKGTDQRVGLTTQQSLGGMTFAGQSLLARKGTKVVSVTAVSGDATAPAVAPAQSLLKVAVKAAR